MTEIFEKRYVIAFDNIPKLYAAVDELQVAGINFGADLENMRKITVNDRGLSLLKGKYKFEQCEHVYTRNSD